MTHKKPRADKPFTRMTADELAAATKKYDRGALPDDVGEAMTPAERAQWSNGKPGRGRPRKGLGAVNVLISFERGLLDRADAFARGRGIGRSALVAEAIEALIGDKSMSRRRRASA
ncbi:MAG TPA: hypothetical protein VG269_22610 [Tepidisphaeraceae bacterium]|jgi:hypothetical protein|nr:hypothetical protein [Tepidisphaeraceae bacterium]